MDAARLAYCVILLWAAGILLWAAGVPIGHAQPIRSGADENELLLSNLLQESNFFDEEFLTDGAVEEYLARLEGDLRNPIDLQKATLSELLAIPTVSLSEARLLQRYAQDRTALRDLPNDRLRSILPFVGNALPMTTEISTRHRGIVDPQAAQTELYQRGHYQGSPWKVYNKIYARESELTLSVIQSKDAGEPKLLDHVSGNLQYNNADQAAILEQIIVGGFAPQFGEGILFSHGAIYSRSLVGVLDVAPAVSRLYGYSASGVSRFLFGGAVRFGFGKFTLDAFGSSKFVDASIDTNGIIRTLPIDGYHRTATEIARKFEARQRLLGCHLEYGILSESDKFITAELTGYAMSYDHRVDTRSLTAFKGSQLHAASAAFRSGYKQFLLSGEAAVAKGDSGRAAVGIASSASISFSESFEMSFNVRQLPVDFISPYGSVFGHSVDDAQNETGAYLGARYRVGALTVAAALDASRNLKVLMNRAYRRGLGDGYLGLGYQASQQLWFYGHARIRAHSAADAGAPLSERFVQSNYRIEATYAPSANWQFRARAERVGLRYTSDSSQSGWLTYLNGKYIAEGWSAETWVERIHSASYASRLYAWEPSLPGYSAIAPLYGDMTRLYLLLNVRVVKAAALSAKFSTSLFDSPRTTGSGISAKTQRHDDRIEFQLDFTF